MYHFTQRERRKDRLMYESLEQQAITPSRVLILVRDCYRIVTEQYSDQEVTLKALTQLEGDIERRIVNV